MELKVLDSKKKMHPLRYIALGAVFFIFLFFAVYSIGLTSAKRKEKQAELDSLNRQIQIVESKIADLKNVSNYSDEEYLEYVISKAHNDLDYVRSGEIVYYIK